MLDKEAIQELAQSESIRAASDAVDNAGGPNLGLAPLPNNFELQDLERYLPKRRRQRGKMTTSVIADFARYVKDHAEAGASVFVDPDSMSATAVLNLGGPAAPGHADNTATLALRRTAAFMALQQHASGSPLTQVQVAEFIEDWAHAICCRRDDEVLDTKKAIAAVRSITIEGLRRVQSNEQQLSASKSAFESVEAKADELLPTLINFSTEPYHGLTDRTYVLRLGIRTGDKPAITLRIVNAERHAEECAAELAQRVREAIEVPVLLGSYKPA